MFSTAPTTAGFARTIKTMKINIKRYKSVQIIILLFSLALFALSIFQTLSIIIPKIYQNNLTDFMVYWQATEKFQQEKNVYDFFYSNPPTAFNYPPSFLLIFSLLKIFPLKTAQILLLIFSYLFFWLGLYLVIRIAKIKVSLPHLLIILSLFNQTFPVKFTLVLGQINMIVLGLTYTSLYFYQKTKKISSAILLSLSGALKIFPLSVLLLFFLMKDYFFVGFVLLLFLSLNLLPSFSLFKTYFFKTSINLTDVNIKPSFYDQSITAFLSRLFQQPLLVKCLALIITVSILFLIIRDFFKRRNLIVSFSLIMALTAIANTFSWQHHLVLSYPLILLTYLRQTRKNKLVYPLMLIFWLLLVFHFPDEKSALLNNPFIASYQTIIILALIGYNIFSIKKRQVKHTCL